jgi:uncharacterized membrane protein YhhN
MFALKALIVPVLMILFICNLKMSLNKIHSIMFTGLFFSFAGDVLLEVPKDYGDMFLPGLFSFLIAQLMYLLAFLKTPGENIVFMKKPWLLMPVLIAGAVLVIYLFKGLGAMKIPVITYAAVILTMVAGAVNRLGKVNRVSYFLVLAGAILFVMSDSSIAINNFRHHFKGASFFIMVTYILAQYLIVTGYIRQFRNDFA